MLQPDPGGLPLVAGMGAPKASDRDSNAAPDSDPDSKADPDSDPDTDPDPCFN